jgi:hypothetical protein
MARDASSADSNVPIGLPAASNASNLSRRFQMKPTQVVPSIRLNIPVASGCLFGELIG